MTLVLTSPLKININVKPNLDEFHKIRKAKKNWNRISSALICYIFAHFNTLAFDSLNKIFFFVSKTSYGGTS